MRCQLEYEEFELCTPHNFQLHNKSPKSFAASSVISILNFCTSVFFLQAVTYGIKIFCTTFPHLYWQSGSGHKAGDFTQLLRCEAPAFWRLKIEFHVLRVVELAGEEGGGAVQGGV